MYSLKVKIKIINILNFSDVIFLSIYPFKICKGSITGSVRRVARSLGTDKFHLLLKYQFNEDGNIHRSAKSHG